MDAIPLYQPDLSGNERRYVLDCLDSSWISSKGAFLKQFEDAFARKIGVRHAAATCNGTVALHLALLALGIGPGDEVIVPTLTYVASVNAISYTGATPIFADSDQHTWQPSAAIFEKLITSRTKAFLAVHLYGNSCDMPSLRTLADEHGISIVEDCAEAIGTTTHGRHVGTIGDIGTFSFFGNKTITTGEGGMVVANNDRLIERARHFKGQGLVAQREYWHDVVGYNYRMTNVAAAIGVAQLERMDFFVDRKRAIALSYRDLLKDLPVDFQVTTAGTRNSHWMVAILARHAEDRDRIRNLLSSHKIETRPVFAPVHTMPMYDAGERCPIAEDLASRGILLPSWPGLGDAQIERIAGIIRSHYRDA